MDEKNESMDLLRAFLVSPNGIMENMFFQTQFFITAHNISPLLDARKRTDFFPDSTVPKTNLAGWKITMFNRKYIFKTWIFHCHVSFRGGKPPFGCGVIVTSQNIQPKCLETFPSTFVFSAFGLWNICSLDFVDVFIKESEWVFQSKNHKSKVFESIWVFPKIAVPQNGWFTMENLLKWMIIKETPIYFCQGLWKCQFLVPGPGIAVTTDLISISMILK